MSEKPSNTHENVKIVIDEVLNDGEPNGGGFYSYRVTYAPKFTEPENTRQRIMTSLTDGLEVGQKYTVDKLIVTDSGKPSKKNPQYNTFWYTFENPRAPGAAAPVKSSGAVDNGALTRIEEKLDKVLDLLDVPKLRREVDESSEVPF